MPVLSKFSRELVARLKTVANKKRQVGDSYNESINQSTQYRRDSVLCLQLQFELGTQCMKPHWAHPTPHSTRLSQFDAV